MKGSKANGHVEEPLTTRVRVAQHAVVGACDWSARRRRLRAHLAVMLLSTIRSFPSSCRHRDRSHQATGQAFRDVTGVWLYKAVERQRKAVQAQGQAAEQQGDAVVQQGKAP